MHRFFFIDFMPDEAGNTHGVGYKQNVDGYQYIVYTIC